VLPTTIRTTKKVLIVEELDILREKIAGIISSEENISMVIQVSSYSKLQTALEETNPDLVLGDLLELRRFCEKTGISAVELCSNANILLYTDEDEPLQWIEAGHHSEQRIINVRRIQQEVKTFLQNAKHTKQSDKS
jgi:DNA-binding NarL/FixJ family response regulator